MSNRFNHKLDSHIEVAEDLIECLQSKSKWATGAWTWVSMTNLQAYYDTKVVHTYNGHFTPDKINLGFFLDHLSSIGLVEKNPELFLRDKFYRLTQKGREVIATGNENLYLYLTQR